MNQTNFTTEEAYTLLNKEALESTKWQSLVGGNQKFWTMRNDFKLSNYKFPHDNFNSFEEWETNDDGTIIIRAWSKW